MKREHQERVSAVHTGNWNLLLFEEITFVNNVSEFSFLPSLFSWISENKVYQVDYTADENGYRPHLTIKSVPEAEQKPIVQQESVQSPAVAGDAIVIEIPLSDPIPVVQNDEKEEDILPDAIVLDIPVSDASSSAVESNSQETIIEVTPDTLIGSLFAGANSSQGKAEKTQTVADEVETIPAIASAPVVQQDNIQVKPQQVVVEEVKPDKLVVETPVQSSPLAVQQDKSQVQLSSQDEPSAVEQEKVVANEGIVIPYESDVYAQDDGYSTNDDVKPETSEIYSPPTLNFQHQQDPSDDEIYTDDAVIIDAAGDSFSSDSTQNDKGKDWGKPDSQDAASDFLNAMLQEYLNQFYGNSKQQVEIEENSRSKVVGDDLGESDSYYYNEDIPEKDVISAVVDHQRMSPEDNIEDEYVISLDDLYDYYQQLQVANQDRARSKVDDSIQDEGQTDEEMAAYRFLKELAESYDHQPYASKKQNSKFESDNQSHDYAIDESLMRQLYYQQWLKAQRAPQEEAMYYAIYPESAYYYR